MINLSNISIELIILILAVILIFVAYLILSSKGGGNEEWKINARKELNRIIRDQKESNNLEQTLIKSDKLLDFCLKNSKVRGNTLGERLKFSKKHFSNSQYNNIWTAHKLRNKLVHEIGFSVSKSELNKCIEYLKSGIKTLL